ncbi:hypothetical protein CMUS01_13997 [Colletotrichum musicola]|uniref:Uncharacterized protein n=1 Tax=Colletotrichum musicola TaxID=2175873 RepID=A0A8H6MTU4_9PEZI|nr:hypothetical protein CMUS01_13997 [Colletotrichum musicola]
MHLRSLLVVALALTLTAAVDRFLPPFEKGLGKDYAHNEVYVVGKEVKFTWQTDSTKTDLCLWTDFQGENQITTKSKCLRRNLTTQEFVWVVGLEGLPTIAIEFGVFFLTLYSSDTDKLLTTSNYFNITQASAATSASSSSSAKATSTLAANEATQQDRGITDGIAGGISSAVDQGESQSSDVTRDRATLNTTDYAPAGYAPPMQQQKFVNEQKSPALVPPVPFSPPMGPGHDGNHGSPPFGNGRPSELGGT